MGVGGWHSRGWGGGASVGIEPVNTHVQTLSGAPAVREWGCQDRKRKQACVPWCAVGTWV